MTKQSKAKAKQKQHVTARL